VVERVEFQAAETPADKPADQTTERPAEVPEKFWKDGKLDTASLLKSYGELESKQGKAKVEEKPADKTADEKTVAEKAAADKAEAERVAKLTPEQKAAEEKTKADADAAKKVADASTKVDLPSLEAKYLANGNKLDDADYAGLEAKGFTRQDVNDYIAFRTSQGNALMEPVGGQEGWEIVSAWAKTGGYNEGEAKAFNEAMDSNDKGRQLQAMKALKAAFDAKKGRPGKGLTPTNVPPAGGDSYASQAQFLSDVNTPKYKTDPAERERVKAKLARSKI
jgi:hypothetical protein